VSPRLYLASTTFVAAVVYALIVGAVIFTDPDGVFAALGYRSVDPTAEQLFLASLGRYPVPQGNREAKILDSYWYKPTAIIFGSSNVWSYFDTNDPLLRQPDGRRPYNFGLAGESIVEMEQSLRHVVTIAPPQFTMFNLEFFMFNGRRPDWLAEYPLAFLPDAKLRRLQTIKKYVVGYQPVITLAEGARGALIKAISIPEAHSQTMASPSGEPAATTNVVQRSRLRDVDRLEIAVLYLTLPSELGTGNPGPFSFNLPEGGSTFDSFRRTLDIVAANRAQVRIFLSPHEVREYEIIRALGLWPLYKTWIRELASAVRTFNEGRPCAQQASLLDFGGYGLLNDDHLIEDVPDQLFSRFADSFHYTTETGRRIISSVMKQDCTSPAVGDIFVDLAKADVEAHLDQVDRDREAFAARHPDEVADVKSVIDSLRE